ncbi:putative disease resistance protein At4g19050 [Rutidosis leptorrhynchoides]|uniref:putative disease resistance protein At4g19050 n=1 Tax=Rutidosis leptorrhynchoides TaxID=125765 RepID=UPI003A9A63EE
MADTNTSNPQKTNFTMEDLSSIQKDIYKALQDEEVKTINIFGAAGAGKTRMAKRVSERCIRDKLFNFTIWAFMCRAYTENSLSVSIARQLCLYSADVEWEVEDDDKEQKNDNEVEKSDNLIEKIRAKLKGNKVLIILDDFLAEKENENENKFREILKNILPDPNFKTVLVSRVKRDDKSFDVKFEVQALSKEPSNSLLIEKLNPEKKSKILEDPGKKLIEKINPNLPGHIIILAKALNCLGSFEESSILDKELEEASEKYSVSKLLCTKHDVLPIGVLKDLWWRGPHFFRDSGSVHYSELITYWILEGFLGFGSMTNLYKKGHAIVIELMECGVLKRQEDGYVFMDQSLIKIEDLYDQCVDENPSLGLATLFTSDAEGFGRITHEDGMLKTPSTRKRHLSNEVGGQDHLTTLLLDGTHFTEQEIFKFLESEKKLQVLALFNPTIKSLKSFDMNGLRVLVLRGCEYLQVLPDHPLKSLNVLEISGARSLKALRSVFFRNMSNLKSLHLSGLQITRLPLAFYDLQELQWLIIKDCPGLKKLESISKLKNLLVVDLSGNTALKTVDKNFLNFTKLQTLNLSQTSVSTTPLLRNIGSITHLLCHEGKELDRLRGLNLLTSLQTIDLSGSKKFEEFHDSSLQSLNSLRTLELSGTLIDRLPYNISKPRYLYLKNCLQLTQLSNIESFVKLEELDLSGSTNLDKIQDGFFDQMTNLRILNLSETNVQRLPSLSNLSDLRELLLSRCKSLTHLPSLKSSSKLEIFDVLNCSDLEDLEDESFKLMTRLQKLDCSETKIKSLPSLSDPSNLRQLLLKNCKALTNLELNVSFLNLEELNLSGVSSFKRAEFINDISTLRILDLSNTSIELLPSLTKLTNLTHISLADCKFIETELDLSLLSKLEVLDLSRTSIKRLLNLTNSKNLQKLLLKGCSNFENFTHEMASECPKIPNDISELSHLDYLELPNLESDTKQQDEWNVCELSDNGKPPVFHSGSQLLQFTKYGDQVGPYHLCAIPAKVDGQTGDRYLQRHDLVFRDLYLEASHFTKYKENKLLQIRGFNHFPNGIENIIREVDVVFLIDYKLKGLQPGFDPSILRNIKGLWIERCDEFITIFSEKEDSNNSSFELSIENFRVSNNLRLENIYNGNKSFMSFNCLKSLHLDNCPKLTTVFTSWFPINLEDLQIKYCDKMTSLSENGGELPNLQTLHLWEVPELENINILFPNIETLKIWECPKLKETNDQFEVGDRLKKLWICGASSLKSLCTRNKGLQDSINLENLKLENCAMLEYVMSSSSPLQRIHTIEITSCEKIRTLFTQNNDTITRLNTLRLKDLPVLKSIGTKFTSSENMHAFECPNLRLEGVIVD